MRLRNRRSPTKTHVRGCAAVQSLALFIADQGGAKFVVLLAVCLASLGGEVEETQAKLILPPRVLGQKIVDETVAGHRIEAWHPLEDHLLAIHPHPGKEFLAADDLFAQRAADDHGHIALALGGAEQQQTGTNEARGDGDDFLRQVDNQGLLRADGTDQAAQQQYRRSQDAALHRARLASE